MNRSEYEAYLTSRDWALKKEDVRRRANNRCERCLTARMDAVHHLTYERLGHEPLEDLMAICDPCHEFLSAKSDVDPLTAGVGVYLAGPITGNRWRDSLLTENAPRLRSNADPSNYISAGDEWPISKSALIGGFDLVGPYFEDLWGGHGGNLESGTHGADIIDEDNHCCIDPQKRHAVAHRCLKALHASDLVFCWLPEATAFGTLWELGYATASLTPVVIGLPDFEGSEDMWFAQAQASWVIPAESALSAWKVFLTHWAEFRKRKELRREYLFESGVEIYRGASLARLMGRGAKGA